MIFFLIIITFSLDTVLISRGEIGSWSLMGLEGLDQLKRGDTRDKKKKKKISKQQYL